MSDGKSELESTPTSASTAESEQPLGWKTAIAYGATALVMLALVAITYGSYARRVAEERNADLLFARDFSDYLQKSAAVGQLRSEFALLERQIATVPGIPADDKNKIFSTTDSIDAKLTALQSVIDQAIGRLDEYRSLKRNSSGLFFFSFIEPAYAQSTGPDTAKYSFAIAAFLVLVVITFFCIWMIGREDSSQADKKWARDLIAKEIAFLFGIVGGIVLKG
jgi:hypothetical protein